MEKNASMERRFSLNMTNPVAESTCLNLNGSGHMSKTPKFRWGGSPINSKNRSNSSVCLNTTTASNKSRGASSPHRARINLNKIDPRIYADVQSKGLASRIVQYHENGSRLNRSMSTSNLYTKPGQFPVVHLQKTELPYRATQQNVSMTRIAPPEKSVFRGNTLSSLLRSNSVISLQKSDEEISRENRPILHPPAAESDLAPTRSVLDVLKEISRKRINSDDSDNIHDATKKYCNRDCNDAPSYETVGQNANLRNINTPMHPILYPTQCFKRQRESVTLQQPLEYAYTSPNASIATAKITKSTQTQNSPEQIAKKRLCSYNNDITSSLSSSLIHANKRKFYEQQRSTAQRSPPASHDDFETQRSKRQQSDLRFQQINKSLSCTTPITPIPDTPLHQNIEDLQRIPINGDNPAELLQNIVSEPPYANIQTNNKVNTAEKNQKPRLTLFNRNYDETTDVGEENEESDELELNANNECADIQFVKPKKSSSILNAKNPLIERTQKSKLALMFSGLRGELYQEDDDEVDKANTTQTPVSSSATVIQNSFKVTVSSVNVTNTTTTTTTVLSAAMKSDNSKSATANNTTNSCPTSSPSLTPTTIATSTATPPTSSNIATTSSKIGGFKFTPPTTTVATNISSSGTINKSSVATSVTTAGPVKTSSPLVGLKLTPQVPTQPALSSTITPSVPSFTFGTPSVNAVANSISTGLGAVPQLIGFASNKTNNTAATATAVAASATTSATIISNKPLLAPQAPSTVGGFKFGATSAAITSNSAIPASPVLSFGSITTTASPPTTVSTLNTAPTFTFGSSTNKISTVSTNTQPSINFTATTTTASTFNFGATKANTAKVTVPTAILNHPTNATVNTQFGSPNPSNVFGASNNLFATATTTTATAAAKPFSFGAATSASTAPATTSASITTNTFSFGGTNSAPQKPPVTSTTFAFGTSKPAESTTSTTAATFAFGAVTQPTTTSTVPTTSAPASIFSFGGGPAASSITKTNAAANSNSSNSNLFSFGSGVASTTITAAPTNPPKAFSNTAVNIDTNQSMQSTKPSTFSFGSTSAVGANQQLPTSFGSANTNSAPFAFGGTNSNKSITSTSTGGFNFGSTAGTSSSTNSTPTNLFGSSTNNPTPSTAPNVAPATHIVKPSFNFGGNIAITNADTSKSLFGGVTTNNANNSNSAFGSLVTTNDNQQKSFTFAQNSGPVLNNNVNNIFSSTAPTKPATGGFAFNATTLNKPTAAAAPNAGSFTFGGANSMNNSTNASFNFGNNNASATNKAFNFGSSSTTPNTVNSGSIFGGGAAMTNGAESTQTAATPFSLSAGMTTAAPAVAPPSNLFTPQPNMSSGPNDRPIRRATRRLQKS